MNNRVFFLLSLAAAVSLLIAACVSPSGPNVDTDNLGNSGSGAVASCTLPQVACGGTCVLLDSNPNHCGACNAQCAPGTTCAVVGATPSCVCGAGLSACATGCEDLQIDANHCGNCTTVCSGATPLCSNGVCSAGCAGTQLQCGNSCVDVTVSPQHCGACGAACSGGRSCAGGACTCPAGQVDCAGACVAAGTCTQVVVGNAGAGGAPPGGMAGNAGTTQVGNGGVGTGGVTSNAGTGAGGTATVIPNPEGRTCPTTAGLVSDFEESSTAILAVEGRGGIWEGYGDAAGTQTVVVEADGATECNQGVLHMSGSGYAEYVGLAGVLYTTETNAEGDPIPLKYDASQYTGLSFRAKAGPGQTHPVRIGFPTPWTEGGDYGDCIDGDADDEISPCWNHLGHFLIDDHALTSDWQTFNFCFARDLHPMFLPSGTTDAQRATTAANLLKIQFLFNQGFDPATAEQYPFTAAFDFFLDDVRFTTGACATDVFQSTDSAAQPFGSNTAIGSCSVPADADVYDTEITQAYRRWKAAFVKNDGSVQDPQEGNRVVSEAIGYGMLVAAAMGDKPTFDAIWGWAKGHGSPGSLLGWENGGGGSATDADTDMAYALYMANKQWPSGGYAAAAGQIASAALSGDVVSGVLVAGNQYKDRLNPSYFSPGFYRAFSGWDNVTSTTNSRIASCAGAFGNLVPDWCDLNGAPQAAGSAQQQAGEVCTAGTPCLAFDGARVPWRLGFDACLGGNSSVLTGFMGALKSGDAELSNGARIDLLSAGWTASGPTTGAVDNAAAFIGPVGVGAMGLNDATTFARAWHTTLDIMERPEYYGTYYQATVGLMALLTMSGNWPVP